eukprot:scaffold189345_cov23-Tisochrysis_lutea.AAC.3
MPKSPGRLRRCSRCRVQARRQRPSAASLAQHRWRAEPNRPGTDGTAGAWDSTVYQPRGSDFPVQSASTPLTSPDGDGPKVAS